MFYKNIHVEQQQSRCLRNACQNKNFSHLPQTKNKKSISVICILTEDLKV